MSRTALIVDDSKSARVVLKRMLERHDLVVDTSESAEEALEYLDSKRPDVIFMDHLMPGMDGFEAVSAIKKNPDTAMIPIMMYTSQEGEVYVGQARALGAVGVLPKTVEPVEVSKVLASLHLTDETPAPATPAREVADGNMRALLADLFEQQRVVLQRELSETIASELRQRQAALDETPDEDELPPPQPARTQGHWPAVLLLAFLVFGIVVLWQQGRIGDLEAGNAALLDDIAAGSGAPASADLERRLAGYQGALAETRAALREALEWGINESGRYAWDEVPLNERRVQLFENLLNRLIAMGFVGQVAVLVHVGDFCLVDDGRGMLTLAPPTLEASACDRVGYDPVESLGLGSRQTVAFANFAVRAEERSGGAIRFEIQSRGNLEPFVAYPESPVGMDADAWNTIAALNNRVNVNLLPDNP